MAIVVRKLITLLGFKVEDKELARYEKQGQNLKSNLVSTADLAKGAAVSLAGVVSSKFLGDLYDANQQFESLKARLETLVGPEQAVKTFEELNQFAKETPNELNDIVDSFIRLKSAGFEVNQDVLKVLGDLGAASGKSFGDVTEILLSANRGMGSMVDNLSGLSAVSEGGLLKMQNAATGLAASVKPGDTKAVLDFFLAAGRAPGVAGGADRLSKTLGGLASTMKDQVAEAFREVGAGGFNDAFKETLRLITELVGGQSSGNAKAFGAALGTALDFVNSGLILIRDNMPFIEEALSKLGTVVKAALLPSIWPLLTLQDLWVAFKGGGGFFDTLFGGKLEGTLLRLQGFAGVLGGIWDRLQADLAPALDRLMEAFGELGAAIVGDFNSGGDVLETLVLLVEGFVGGLVMGMRLVTPALLVVIDGVAWLVRLFTLLWPVVSTVLKRSAMGFLVIAAIIFGPVILGVLTVWAALMGLIVAIGAIVRWFQMVGTTIEWAFSNPISAAIAGFNDLYSSAKKVADLMGWLNPLIGASRLIGGGGAPGSSQAAAASAGRGGGAGGATSNDNRVSVGAVNVQVQGSTNMGPDQVGAASQNGVLSGLADIVPGLAGGLT